MPNRYAFGFSLLELMIVVAIIGILAVIAIPSYQSYARRARFSEVISAAQFYKTAVSLALQQGIPPKEIKNGSHGIPESAPVTNNLASVNVKNAIITALGTERVNKTTYILTPDADSGIWSISGTCIEAGLCSD